MKHHILDEFFLNFLFILIISFILVVVMNCVPGELGMRREYTWDTNPSQVITVEHLVVDTLQLCTAQ